MRFSGTLQLGRLEVAEEAQSVVMPWTYTHLPCGPADFSAMLCLQPGHKHVHQRCSLWAHKAPDNIHVTEINRNTNTSTLQQSNSIGQPLTMTNSLLAVEDVY